MIRLKPEHISAYSLIIEKGTPFYERYKFDAVKQEAGIHTEILPDEDEVYRIYKATQDVLKQAGYRQYEISNFAQPGYACRHNIGYWTRKFAAVADNAFNSPSVSFCPLLSAKITAP